MFTLIQQRQAAARHRVYFDRAAGGPDLPSSLLRKLISIISLTSRQCDLTCHVIALSHYFDPWGTWVAQSVQHLTFDVHSGRDPTVHEFESRAGLCIDCLGFSLSLSLPLPCLLCLSLKINKQTLKKKKLELLREEDSN